MNGYDSLCQTLISQVAQNAATGVHHIHTMAQQRNQDVFAKLVQCSIAARNRNPVPHIQIELFEKDPDGKVKITLHKTNDKSEVLLPVKPQRSYLADMVILREPSAEVAKKLSVVWETLWASLTFSVPEFIAQ